ncbi:MAG: ABC-2 transporter permease [Clostridia bacterium]|nr:ABC-2 transporter permease [Clostridia bacterium]
MKRAIIRERAALSDTAKVWWLITLFTAFLGAYLGGKEGSVFPSMLCSFSYMGLYTHLAEINATAEYIRFTETLPLSAREKVWGKLIYHMTRAIPISAACFLGYLPGLVSANSFSTEKLLSFGILQCLLCFLPAAIFPLLTVKREGTHRYRKSILLLAICDCGAFISLDEFFDGSFSFAPLPWAILLCGSIILFLIAAEWAVSLWEDRPLP